MRFIPVTFLLALLSSALIAPASAGDVNAGRARAAQCSVCHGANGISTLAEAPNLAGQSGVYLREQLRNYRSGKRNSEVMGILAKHLTDTEIDDLAAWFSAIEVEAKLPK
ncbi:MAG: cytochrome c [Betaproteobacteria bacterium]